MHWHVPLIVVVIVLFAKFDSCHGTRNPKKSETAEDGERHTSTFQEDLYPTEYQVPIPISLVYASEDYIERKETASEDVSSGENSSGLRSRSDFSTEESSEDSSESSGELSDKILKSRGGLTPTLALYWKKQKPKKRKKNGPKLTSFWGPPAIHHNGPHGPGYHGHHHGPPPRHHHRRPPGLHRGPPPVYHGTGPHGHGHRGHGPPDLHHHGPPPHAHKPIKVKSKKHAAVVAIWKENQKHAPKPKPLHYRPKDWKHFHQPEVLPDYLSDLATRLVSGLGVLNGYGTKEHGHHAHSKHSITYHNGFYTEVQ